MIVKIPIAGPPSAGPPILVVHIPATGNWRYVVSELNNQGDTVIAEIQHFSRYKLVYYRPKNDGLIAWKVSNLPVNKGAYSDNDMREAVSRAFANWGPHLVPAGITLTETSHHRADITITWTDEDMIPSRPFSGLFDDLVHSEWTVSGSLLISCYDALKFASGAVTYSWAAPAEEETSVALTDIDVEMFITHALGHLLGSWGHLGTGTAPPMMAPRFRPGDALHDIVNEDIWWIARRRSIPITDRHASCLIEEGRYSYLCGFGSFGKLVQLFQVSMSGTLSSIDVWMTTRDSANAEFGWRVRAGTGELHDHFHFPILAEGTATTEIRFAYFGNPGPVTLASDLGIAVSADEWFGLEIFGRGDDLCWLADRRRPGGRAGLVLTESSWETLWHSVRGEFGRRIAVIPN